MTQEQDPMQLTPTTSFWIKDSVGGDGFRIIALSTAAPSGFSPNTEHWYRRNVTNAKNFFLAPTVQFYLNARCPTASVCSSVQADITAVSDAAKWTRQFTDKTLLDPSDWIAGTPVLTGEVHYFTGTVPGSGAPLQLAFVTNNAVLLRVVWMADARVKSYFDTNVPGDFATLTRTTTPPTKAYYHSSP